MAKYKVYLTTFDRGRHPVTGKTNPYHWAYFIKMTPKGGPDVGVTYQLHGAPGGWRYNGPEDADLTKGPRPIEKLAVGTVDESQLPLMYQILSKIHSVDLEVSERRSQDWALEGFEMLKKEGIVYEYLGQEFVKAWLKENDIQ